MASEMDCAGACQCRLPGAEGTWMVVRGGMGTVTSQLAQAWGAPAHTFSQTFANDPPHTTCIAANCS